MNFYHIFPPGNYHHVPGMIRFFAEGAVAMGTRNEDHVFVLRDQPEEGILEKLDNLSLGGSTLKFISKRRLSLFLFLFFSRKGSYIVLHGAGLWPLICVLFLKHIWQRTCWIMWGFDVHLLREMRIHGGLFVRCVVRSFAIMIHRLRSICALVPGDAAVLQEAVGPCTNCMRVFYSTLGPDDVPARTASASDNTQRPIRVILGNSGAQSNRHLEALSWLARFSSENIEVVCPLGYGGDNAYAETVISHGRATLGTRFEPICHMLSNEDYTSLLATVDVYMFNHLRQQGLFAVYYCLATGRKIYLRPETPTYSLLRELGFVVFSTLDIPTLSFRDFVMPLDEMAARANRVLWAEHLSKTAAVESWRALFRTLGVAP